LVNIDHAVIHSVATTPKQVENINLFIKECVVNGNGRFTGLGALHPFSDDIDKDVQQIVSLQLKGVKVHPDIQKFQVDDGVCDKMYSLCVKNNLPLLMHTGDNRYNNSNPEQVEKVLNKFPDLRLIGAHFGGWSIWNKAYKTLSKFENFIVDCSSSFYYMTDDEIKMVIDGYGIDKVCFASDYPMWKPKEELERLLSLGFNRTALEKLLYKNAVKAFSIEY